MRSRCAAWTLACLLAGATLAGCTNPMEARGGSHAGDEPTVHAPGALAWGDAPASLPPGARAAVLAGDPTAEGPFTLRLEVPAGYQIPPHTHPRAEHVTILAGVAHLGSGATMDLSTATELTPGTFFEVPPGMVHYFVASDAPVVLQLHGEGPWSIDYVGAGA